MYAVIVETDTDKLHEVHRAKLKQYQFTKIDERKYECENTVDDLLGVMFYKRNLCDGPSPFTVTSRRTGRIA